LKINLNGWNLWFVFHLSISKTHPSGILKDYQIKNVKKALAEVGSEIESENE